MKLVTNFQMLARYSRMANERLFAKCAQLDDAEYRKRRAGSFGSIHGLLNHILLGDRRWMGLFESGERVTPPLNQILYDDFSGLRNARGGPARGTRCSSRAPTAPFSSCRPTHQMTIATAKWAPPPRPVILSVDR